MTRTVVLRERHAWIAAVAVLAVSLAWLAALDVVLLTGLRWAGWPALATVGRALGHALQAVLRQTGPVAWALPSAVAATATLAAAALVAALFRRRPAAARGGLRHG